MGQSVGGIIQNDTFFTSLRGIIETLVLLFSHGLNAKLLGKVLLCGEDLFLHTWSYGL